MNRTCPLCNFTGEMDASGSLDCTACNAATERAAMNAFADKECKRLTQYDRDWTIYLRAMKLAEAEHAKEKADLLAMLRKMWGWAVELDHDGAFFNIMDDNDPREEWRSDTRAALARLQAEKKG